MSSTDKYNVFTHLTAEKSPLYRAILQVFGQAKTRFVIHLRPREIERQLIDLGMRAEVASPIEPALQQLVAWGNLESHPWRPCRTFGGCEVRSLYQISPAGEAAEAALAVFEQSIQQPGELQSAALDEIRRQLQHIVDLLWQQALDDADVVNTFMLLRQRFEELTAQAQRFISGLQRRIDLQSLDVQAFLAYKHRLIDYLERFLSELGLTTHAHTHRLLLLCMYFTAR